jgi:hypothetical protein
VAPPSFLRTFLRLFARRGCPIRRGQTLQDYLARLKSGGLVADECDALVHYVYDISYRARPRARSVEKSFLTLLRRLAK